MKLMTTGIERLNAAMDRARAEQRGALSVYLTAGYPNPAASRAAFDAAITAGADWIEFGIPFSDPAADGPVIEAAANQALAAGATVSSCLALARELREAHPDTPLIAMTYANLAYQMGWDGWAKALAEAGIDGCILPDVPLEEAEPARDALAAAGLAWVPLVTPTTSAERMAAIAATATGFLYVVANVGITGQSDPGPLVEATAARARAAAPGVPLCVGFGVSSADDVRRVLAAGVDGVIVGSRVVRELADAGPAGVGALVASLGAGLTG